LNPDEPVMIAGEPELRAMNERLQNGIPIDDRTWSELRELAAASGVESMLAAD
jgi:LDH2 family malate/lactate/ureidoglycolate dehydrogenase